MAPSTFLSAAAAVEFGKTIGSSSPAADSNLFCKSICPWTTSVEVAESSRGKMHQSYKCP